MDERVLSFGQRDPQIPDIPGEIWDFILGAKLVSIGIHFICDPYSTSHDNPAVNVDSKNAPDRAPDC
jgi:hypothetical protein